MRHRLNLAWASGLVALFVGGCSTPALSPQPLWGAWGGQHIGLVLGTIDSAIEYDCGEGMIIGPVIVHDDGGFDAEGTHTPGTGGPVRAGSEPPTYPARYRANVRGDVMTLVVDVAAIGTRIGPYRLRRGDDPVLTRCL